MNLFEKPNHLPASRPGPLTLGDPSPPLRAVPLGGGGWLTRPFDGQESLAPEAGPQPSSSLCLCPAPDRCLPAHAALRADHAAASPARDRQRGPAAQAGAAQAHGQVRPSGPGPVVLRSHQRQPPLQHGEGERSGLRGPLVADPALTFSGRDPRRPSNHATPEPLLLFSQDSAAREHPRAVVLPPGVWL